jgi:filamentous hemagglutinin family protein
MKITLSLLIGVSGVLLTAGVGWSQAIVPQDTTIVTPTGNEFNITGGQTAGTNLFHSFSQFGLSQVQTANFAVPETIQNVFSRVTGGNPSVIDGALKASGGLAPNFYFMNPAGIVFGPNFTLNLPGAFTATTANGIGFGNNWFNAVGPNNYTNLTGDPTAFGFTMAQPAAIVNNASIASKQSLALIAGTVISPGELKGDGLGDSEPRLGTVTIAAVPGSSLVRITSAGNLLGLEIRPFRATENKPNAVVAAIPSLAELVTGPGPDVTGVRKNLDGTVSLTGAGISIQTGDVQTGVLDGRGVLIGAPIGNVTVSTIAARDLGVDITAGKRFQAIGTFGPASPASRFSELLDPQKRRSLEPLSSELLDFLKLKTGLTEADVIQLGANLGFTSVILPSQDSILVRDPAGTNGKVVIRYGGDSIVSFLGRGGTTSSGNGLFSLGANVTLNSPDLADRYSLKFGDSFAGLAQFANDSTQSNSRSYGLERNQSATPLPIPLNSSGMVGGVRNIVTGDGSLSIVFANQLFNSPAPTNPVPPVTANPLSPVTTNPVAPITANLPPTATPPAVTVASPTSAAPPTPAASAASPAASAASPAAPVTATPAPAIAPAPTIAPATTTTTTTTTTAPVTATPAPPVSDTPTNSAPTPNSAVITNIAPGNSVNTQGNDSNTQCPSPSGKMASGKVNADRQSSANSSGKVDCPSIAQDDDAAILKLLE